MTAQQSTFIESHAESFCDGDENTWQEIKAADDLTVATRKRASAFAAAFNAVFRRSGLREACHTLKLDQNDIKARFLTMMDAAQIAEYEAEQSQTPYLKVRRFKCAAYKMECYHKRTPPFPPRELPEEEKQKWINARARNWRRGFKSVHLAQCFTHLSFFVSEKGEAGSLKKQASYYTDNFSDVVADTARRAKGKGDPVGRYNRAADEALAAFRESVKPYAPEWTIEAHKENEEATPEKTPAKTKTDDPRASVNKAARKLVTEALRVVREQKMNSDEEADYRLAIQTEIETLWTSRPPADERPKAKRAALDTPSPVLSSRDTPKNDAPATDLDRTSKSYLTSEETQNHSAKTESVSPVNALKTLSPDETARLTVEAFESVGCDKFMAVFVGSYPLVGTANTLGSEPRKGESITAAQIKMRLPVYVQRNQDKHHNVALRAWGALWQVDDCPPEVVERLKPFAFLIVETSPQNCQVWIALPKSFVGADGKRNDACHALRKRLLDKFEQNGEGANGGAYGSIRLPGTLNIKEKYQSSFPRIQLSYVALGRITTPEELEAAGLLAAAAALVVPSASEPPRYSNSKLSTVWPNHQDYVNRAPLNDQGKPDLSRADVSYVVRCFALGHTEHSVGDKLRSLRDKAAKRDDYVQRTIRAARAYLASQPVQQHGREQATI